MSAAEGAKAVPEPDEVAESVRPVLGLVSGPVERVDPSEMVGNLDEDGVPVRGLQDGYHHSAPCNEVLAEAFNLLCGWAWVEDGKVVGSIPPKADEELIVYIEGGRMIGGLLMVGDFVSAGAYDRVARQIQVAGRWRGRGVGKGMKVAGKTIYPELSCGKSERGFFSMAG